MGEPITVEEKLGALVLEVEKANDGVIAASKGLETAREALKNAMVENDIKDISIPRYDANNLPIKGIVASLKSSVTTTLNQDALKVLLTDEEKKPYTNFKMTVGDLEDSIKKGVITREDPAELGKIQQCIVRLKSGKATLVVSGLEKVDGKK